MEIILNGDPYKFMENWLKPEEPVDVRVPGQGIYKNCEFEEIFDGQEMTINIKYEEFEEE